MRDEHQYDVMLKGPYFCDMIFTGLPRMPKLGEDLYSQQLEVVPGGTFYTATAMKRLGLRTGWVCQFGNDMFSQFVLQAAQREGLDEALFQFYDHPVRSVAAAFSFPHERGFVSYMDPLPEVSLMPLIQQYKPRCLFLPSLRTDILEMIEVAHRVGTMVYMDCQAHHTSIHVPEVDAVLRAVDIFAPNSSEALALTGCDSAEKALEELNALTPLVIIKSGAQGAAARDRHANYQVPGISVTPIDTTGAGDCFNAGFLYGYLRGRSVEECLRLGNICGGLSTTAPGGSAVPTADEAQAWLNRYS